MLKLLGKNIPANAYKNNKTGSAGLVIFIDYH